MAFIGLVNADHQGTGAMTEVPEKEIAPEDKEIIPKNNAANRKKAITQNQSKKTNQN
ncbi:hypothetical protein FACS1894198_4260 [Clostridia bacterium]|nr:hypothetical protein FACS1894198_4260 [Clostridia bacterium]